jgi:ribonuclease VapC
MLFDAAIVASPLCLLPATCLQEARMVLVARRGESVLADLALWLAKAKVETVNIDAAITELATQAFLDFGKGRHRAGLNFGDCFAYAVAKATDEPLLFKGNDFSQTDIRPALR